MNIDKSDRGLQRGEETMLSRRRRQLEARGDKIMSGPVGPIGMAEVQQALVPLAVAALPFGKNLMIHPEHGTPTNISCM